MARLNPAKKHHIARAFPRWGDPKRPPRSCSVVVGRGSSAEGQEAFLWDSTNGMRRLNDVLAAAGADLTGWTLTVATAVSDDARTFVGLGRNPEGNYEAWIASLDGFHDGPGNGSVPEPTAVLVWSLLGGGGIGISWWRKKSA